MKVYQYVLQYTYTAYRVTVDAVHRGNVLVRCNYVGEIYKFKRGLSVCAGGWVRKICRPPWCPCGWSTSF